MDSSSFTHVGWVPCVSGRLFFRHANCGMGAAPITHVNAVERRPHEPDGPLWRHVLIASTVNWRDQARDARGRPTSGLYRVTLQASGLVGVDVIDGAVHLVPLPAAATLYSDIDQQIAALQARLTRRQSIAADMQALRHALTTLTPSGERGAQKIIRFRLHRHGLVLLRLDQAEQYDAATVQAAVRSGFYYVKNTWHVHKHHHRDDESLTTVHSLSRGLNVAAWHLLDDLKEAVVSKNRDAHPADEGTVNRARGLASYAKSLTSSLYEQGLITKRQKRVEYEYLNNVMDSLRVSSDNFKRIIGEGRRRGEYFRNAILFLLAALAPSAVMYKDAVEQQLGADKDYSNNVLVGLYARFFGSDYSIFIGIGVLVAAYWLMSSMLMGQLRLRLAQRRFYRWWIHHVADKWLVGVVAGLMLCLLGAIVLFYSLILLAR